MPAILERPAYRASAPASATVTSGAIKPPQTRGVHLLKGEHWLDPVFALHQQVRAEMPESNRRFLLPKPRDYFSGLLAGKSGVLFGAFADDALVGSLSLLFHDSFAAAHAAGRLTCPDADSRMAKKYGRSAVAVIQSMGVQDAYMGRGISNALLEAALAEAGKQGSAHVFAQIAAQNTLSWLRFMAMDFALMATWTDGHRRFLLRHLSGKEKERILRRRSKTGRQSYPKTYSQIPIILIQLITQLEQGRVVFLNNDPDTSSALNFIFV